MEAVYSRCYHDDKCRSNSSSPLPSKPSTTPSPNDSSERSVWVAVRARPLVTRERLEGAKACLTTNQAAGSVHLGSFRQFNYDFAFGPEAQQQDVFAGCVSGLAGAVLEGYNATVLAYGPTGSGKTYTMGMGGALHSMEEHHGIIPRVIRQLYSSIAAAPAGSSFVVRAQFLEIYNEEIRDLLAVLPAPHCAPSGSTPGAPQTTAAAMTAGGSPTQPQQRNLAVRECPDGQILVTGAQEVTAQTAEDLLRLLDAGTLARATSGTLLNEQSSRSHAIFTIIIEHSISATCSASGTTTTSSTSGRGCDTASERDSGSPSTTTTDPGSPPLSSSSSTQGGSGAGLGCSAMVPSAPVEVRCAKFHLVDLAGSERASRSGAAGARLREAVNINQGLLALGNVISALSDTERRPGRHVPYRDSKLTRLLQDSLGGNSKTLMIACVSSADDAVEESLNTLKYAARARSIRNRPVLNRHCLYDGVKGIAAEIQAQQILLLRRFMQQLLGPSYKAVLPELLLRDADGADSSSFGDPGSSANVKMLQDLQALASSNGGLAAADACQVGDQQARPAGVGLVVQQMADLQAQVTSANIHTTRLELQLDVCAAEQQALEQAAAVLQQQQAAAWEHLAQEVGQLQASKQLTDTARDKLQRLAHQYQQQDSLDALVGLVKSGTALPYCTSVRSYPLPEAQSSCSEAAAGADPVTGQQTNVQGGTQGLSQRVADLQAELAEKDALLQVARGDLFRDEQIFADKLQEVARLQVELASTTERARLKEEEMTACLQHLQADLRRWRARALSVQTCPADSERPLLPVPPQSPSTLLACPERSPSAHAKLQQELSFAMLHETRTKQQQPGAQPLQQHSDPQQGHKEQQTTLLSDASHSAGDDQVLFDAELASYISDTDYTDLRCADFEADSHLLAELQVVLADKAALEEEKAAAHAEAAAAQRAFEHSRAMLEGQLSHLSSAISSQEALIATLQANEAEAKSMGALYLERCRELEAELAELSLDLQEQTAALTQVEKDVAASTGEKQKLRSEYEGKIEAIVKHMDGLRQQMKQEDGARLDFERQRAAGRIQQLQGELSTMKAQQNKLRQRLQERLDAQDRDAVIKSRELASLRRAAEAARRRVAELEEENRRQRAALRARTSEAAVAKKQLRELASRVSPQVSPRGASSFRASPQATSPCPSAAATSPRTPSKTSPRAGQIRCGNVSPRQQHSPGYAASHARSLGASASPRDTRPSGPAPTEGPAAASRHDQSTAGGSSSSSSSTHDSKQLLTRQVQLLVSEYMAKHRLRQLQAKQSAALVRRDELLAFKAQMQLRQLRRAQPADAATDEQQCSHSTVSSSPAVHSTAEQPTTCFWDPTEQVLLKDCADQLDAVGAQLQHIEELMHKAAADAASAADAAGRLMSTEAGSMSRAQLQELLGLALKELALQATECQETVNQGRRLSMELVEAQQHLQETTCCLQMVQLQHQTELTELQRGHEVQMMALLKQQQQAAPAAAAYQPAGASSATDCGGWGSPAGFIAANGPCMQSAVSALAGPPVCDIPASAETRPEAAAAAATGPSSSQGSRLMDLLHMLAQQGNQEQRHKLLSTLNRLQQLQSAQLDNQQQQQEQSHGQPVQQQQQQLSKPQLGQLERLKLCRAQQRMEHQQTWWGELQHVQHLEALDLQTGRAKSDPQQASHAHVQHQQQQQQPERGGQQMQVREQQQQQDQEVLAGQSSPAGSMSGGETDEAHCSQSEGPSRTSSSSRCSSSSRDGGRSIKAGAAASMSQRGAGSAADAIAAAVGARATCTGLRASASKLLLQAQLCGQQQPSRPAPLRQSSPGPGPGARAQCSSTSGVGGRQTSSLDSPGRSLHAAVVAAASPSGQSHKQRGSVNDVASASSSPTAVMLRKAAQLAMRSSLDVGRRSSSINSSNSSTARLLQEQQQQQRGLESDAAMAAEPAEPEQLLSSSSSSRSSAFSLKLGSSADQWHSRSGSRSARSSHQRICSSTDALRPAPLDVSGESWEQQQQPPSSSSAGCCGCTAAAVADAPAPASTSLSPGKDTHCKTVPYVMLSLRAAAGAGGSACASPSSALKSPYLQYKASAAAAAATAGGGKDQKGALLTPGNGSRGGRSSRGVPPLSPPSTYMRLVQDMS